MVFFALLGATTRLVDTDVQESRVRFCPVCRATRRFDRKRAQSWFQLFFVPVFPIGRGREVFACATCGLPTEVDEQGEQGEPSTLHCVYCGGNIPHPGANGREEIVCPHCGRGFEIRL